MKKPFRQSVFIFVLIVTLTTGCRGSSEYKKLADAGNEYTNAVDKLLVAAIDIHLESTSRQLLDKMDRYDFDDSEDISKIRGRLIKYSQSDAEYLEAIRGLREHNKLLGDYFRQLNKLAASDASANLPGQLITTANNLTRTGKELLGVLERNNATNTAKKPETSNSKKAGLFPDINSPVSSKITGALRSELEQRKDIIMSEIVIQKEMLQLIGDQMEQRAQTIRQIEQERILLAPLLVRQGKFSEQEQTEWIAMRKNLQTMYSTAEELSEASRTLGNLQAVFQGFIEGKSTLDKLNNVSKQIKEVK
ncbi:hypothetical protein NIES2101_01375 [Calothrix sp. HK-06]|nr:hypothetical protein NIES2101_01375 [Calothrix sp. HK-06]